MGCDIHFFVERRAGGTWLTCDKWTKDEDGQRVEYKDAFYHDRNYDLFAILANVRNGLGFAGVKTGEGFNPIAPARGIPADASPEYRSAVESYGSDGHSHSWLTVTEIQTFDWTQTTTKQGVVSPREWARWKTTGRPHAWCGSISGNGVVHVSPEEMEAAATKIVGDRLWELIHDSGNLTRQISDALGGKALNGTDPESAAIAYTVVNWSIPYYEAGAQFLGLVLPRLWRLGRPDDVRAVFFFDN